MSSDSDSSSDDEDTNKNSQDSQETKPEAKQNDHMEKGDEGDDHDDAEDKRKLVNSILDRLEEESVPVSKKNGKQQKKEESSSKDDHKEAGYEKRDEDDNESSSGGSTTSGSPSPSATANAKRTKDAAAKPPPPPKSEDSDQDDDSTSDEEDNDAKDVVKNEKDNEETKEPAQNGSPPAKAKTSDGSSPAEEGKSNNSNTEDDDSSWKPQVLASDFQPTPAHVLCGRRKGHKDFGGSWPGNLALEEVIAEHLDAYEAAGNSSNAETIKAGIIQKILAQVRRCGGGFVRISVLVDDEKKSQQRWMDVGDINARKDVAAIFRLFAQARRYQKVPQQSQVVASPPNVAVARHMAQQVAHIAHQQQQPRQSFKQQTPPQQQQLPISTLKEPEDFQNVAKAQASTNYNQPSLALPTKLYTLQSASKKKENDKDDPPIRKRSTAALENSLAVVPPSQASHLPVPLGVSNKRMHAGIPGVPASGPPMQFERPKKRRSVEESLAVDALQLISKAVSTGDEESATSSSATVRRRSGANIQRPRPSLLDQSETGVKNQVRVCCLQLGQRLPTEAPWDAAQRALACLTSVVQNEQDIDLFVFPELAPLGSSQDTFTKYLPLSHEWQHLYQRVDEAFAEHARLLGVYIVYGTIGWHVRDTDRSLRFKLSHKVLNRQGKVVAVHDKAYLSDLEFRFFDAGHRKAVTFQIDGFNFGLLVGDDLKYPNLARGLARDNDVDVIVHPSADPTPRYFRQCRAVENSLYVLGVEYSTGTTVACPPDPDHDPICLEAADDEREEGYLLTEIQRAALDYARTNFSHYRHMKTEVR